MFISVMNNASDELLCEFFGLGSGVILCIRVQ